MRISTVPESDNTNSSNEMLSVPQRRFDDRIDDFAPTVNYHVMKILLFPRDVNQNKWRNEVASKFAYINGLTVKANKGKKLHFDSYFHLFEMSASVKNYLEGNKEQFLKDGYTLPELSPTDYQKLDRIMDNLARKTISVFTDRKLREVKSSYFRDIIDSVM